MYFKSPAALRTLLLTTGQVQNLIKQCIPVSAMPILSMGAICFFGKSSAAALKVKVPSSFLIILKTRMVSP